MYNCLDTCKGGPIGPPTMIRSASYRGHDGYRMIDVIIGNK
ncbi:14057_t:CDS:1, partial [Cetraspora pellucida]